MILLLILIYEVENDIMDIEIDIQQKINVIFKICKFIQLIYYQKLLIIIYYNLNQKKNIMLNI